MICRHYGREFPKADWQTTDWTSMEDLAKAGRELGFETIQGLPTVSQLSRIGLPCILLWNRTTFVVLRKVKNGIYHIVDPRKGRRWYGERRFTLNWAIPNPSGHIKGSALFITDPRLV